MKIISFNAREWSRDMNPFSPHFWMKRMSNMREMLLQMKPDVICFQEMRWPATWYIPKDYEEATEGNTSHPIYIKKSSDWIDSLFPVLSNNYSTRCLVYKRYEYSSIDIINVHLSCDDKIRKEQLERLSKVSNLERVIICGDFNAIPENVMPYFPHLELLSYYGVPTFASFDGRSEAVIDHIIGNVETRYAVVMSQRWHYPKMSDHSPIIIEI